MGHTRGIIAPGPHESDDTDEGPKDILIALLVPCLVLFYLSVAPYSKVEESFNLQATHDILTYGVPIRDAYAYLSDRYDHLTFTGSVPRTFLGPLLLAGTSSPFAWLVNGINKQILVRAVLGLYNSFFILSYRNAVFKVFGSGTANWYMILQACQFHMMFWASRTLPNYFAFGLSTFALRSFLPRIESAKSGYPNSSTWVQNEKRALTILTILGVVFRSEIAVLLATHTVSLYLRGKLGLQDVIISGLTGLSIGLTLTASIDSYFWQKFPLWPELSGFIYNVLHGESANWGTSPIHYYFTNSLPKLLFNPMSWLVCLPFAMSTPGLRRQSQELALPSLAFIAIYSLVPHKEWRFIVYAMPPLTTVAARGANWIWDRRNKSATRRFFSLALIVSVLGSFAASFAMLAMSSLNYPGADALNKLHALADESQAVINVHMDTHSCMTGITRFLEIPRPADGRLPDGATLWLYDKTDNETQLMLPEFWEKFDYVLAEIPERAIGAWDIVHTVKGFGGIQIQRPEQDTSESETDDAAIGPWPFGEGPWAGTGRRSQILWAAFERIMRKYFTMGWWVAPKMIPQVHILKKTTVL